MREVEERERRNEDPEKEREPTEPRYGLPVQPARLRPVDRAEAPGEAADRGCENDDEREGDERAPDDLQMIAERVEHQRGTNARTTAATRSTKRPTKTATL